MDIPKTKKEKKGQEVEKIKPENVINKAGKADPVVEFFRTLPEEAFFGSTAVQHVYFYGGVDSDSVNALKDDIMAASKEEGDESEPKPIVLHINSPGGCCFAGLTMMSILNECRVPICVCIDGMSCSAATLISILAPYRVMTRYSTCLVHDYTSSGPEEKGDDIMFESNRMEVWIQRVKQMYLKRTKMTAKDLDALMSRDLMLDASTCLKLGVVDRVLKMEPLGFEKMFDKRRNNLVVQPNASSKALLNLQDVLKKNQVNHVRVLDIPVKINGFIDRFTPEAYRIDTVRSLDQLISQGVGLKPVVLHVSSTQPAWKMEPAVIARISTLSRLTLTYAVIDTHVTLIDFLPALFCHKRVAYAHAAVVVHMIYNSASGWMLRDVVENTSNMMDAMRSVLRERTRLPPDMIDNIHARRFFLDADDMLKNGLVDEIIS